MGVYELLMKAIEERDARHYIEALHDDYEFIRHQTGSAMGKSKMSEMMTSMMANGRVVNFMARARSLAQMVRSSLGNGNTMYSGTSQAMTNLEELLKNT